MSEAKYTTDLRIRLTRAIEARYPNKNATLEFKVAKGDSFNTSAFRKNQIATRNKLRNKISLWYKIPDSATGSKPGDVVFLTSSYTVPLACIIFAKHRYKNVYLVPMYNLKDNTRYAEDELKEWLI